MCYNKSQKLLMCVIHSNMFNNKSYTYNSINTLIIMS